MDGQRTERSDISAGTERLSWKWSKTRHGRLVLGASLLVAMTVTAYLPAIQCGYIWDDDDYVQNNQTLRSADGLRRIWFEIGATHQYYPMVHTSYWLEYRIWQLDPMGYHAVNILLHALGAVGLWRVLKVMSVPGAWLAGAIFALHPVHVESVAWITERKNVLSGVFYLTAMLAYLHYALVGWNEPGRRSRRIFYCVSLVLFVCALLSKTVTCTLPAVLLVVLWWKRKRLGWSDVLALAPFLALGVAMGLVTAWMEKGTVGAVGEEWNQSFVERCLIAGRVICFYAGKLLWPGKLAFIYQRWHIDAADWRQYVYPAAVIGVIVSLWLARRRISWGPLAAVLCFTGTLFPALGFFDVYPMRYSFVADHFQYLASAALIALAAAAGYVAADRLGRRARQLATIAAVAVLATLAALTWRQVHMYRDIETLWRVSLRNNPDAWLPHFNLGNLIRSQGKFDEAAEHYRYGLKIKPQSADTHLNLGLALQSLKKFDEAIGSYRHALQIKPDKPDVVALASYNIGTAFHAQGKIDEAIGHYRRALLANDNYPDAHYGLALALASKGKLDEAINHFRRTVQIKPYHAEAHYKLGITLKSRGRLDEAIEHYRLALKVNTNYLLAHNDLGNALQLQGKLNEAIGHYRRALKIRDSFVQAHYNLAKALAKTGRPREALEHFRRAARLNPRWPAPLNEMAWMLATHGGDGVRNGPKAVVFAERAAELTKHQDASILDTLAAAYASAGQFYRAVETAEAAIKLAGANKLADAVRKRLELYKQGKPYLESVRTEGAMRPRPGQEAAPARMTP